ncbi:MAG: RNA polymerase sigma factor [Candidatus Brocadiia bacterium]
MDTRVPIIPRALSDADSALVRRAKTGDFAAFEDLVSRHERGVYSLAMNMLRQRQDAEDVVQTSFLSAFENLGRFREEAAFGTWVRKIAVHAALKVIRTRKRARIESLKHAAEAEKGSVPHPAFIAEWRDPSEVMDRKRLQETLDQAMRALPEKQRLVFVLRDIEGLSVREAARLLAISEGNVKVRLLRARLALRERLTRVFGREGGGILPAHPHEGRRSTSAQALLRNYQRRGKVKP